MPCRMRLTVESDGARTRPRCLPPPLYVRAAGMARRRGEDRRRQRPLELDLLPPGVAEVGHRAQEPERAMHRVLECDPRRGVLCGDPDGHAPPPMTLVHGDIGLPPPVLNSPRRDAPGFP
jgi:hypothetical protein